MGLSDAKQTLTDSTLALVPAPSGGAWIKSARAAAVDRVADLGMPLRRDEDWKFTDPAAWTAVDATYATQTEASDVFAALDPLTLVFVDGAFDADASDALDLGGASIDLLSEASQVDLHWSKSVYGQLEARSNDGLQTDGAALYKSVPRTLAALNTAIAGEGVLIHVTGTPARPIRLSYRSAGGQSVLHHVVKVEAGAEVTLLEEGHPGARSDTMIEVDVADGGTFHHLRVQPDVDEAQVMTQLYARLGAESTVKSFGLAKGGVATRNEAVFEITGDNATAHIAGAVLGGAGTHHDDTVYITHDAVNCESRQVFKKVLRDGATGVFQGKILVLPDAQKTDGYQISQSLLLDDDSQFLAKPELEIYADDVACSHGSTSGAIDETALFYLRSRGVALEDAQNLLTLAFLAEALDEIEDEAASDAVLAVIQTWLGTPV